MDEKLNAILSVALIPQVVSILAEKEGKGEIEATDAFYHSQTYEYLSKEETKVWHYSPLTIYSIWRSEVQTGSPVFPEEI